MELRYAYGYVRVSTDKQEELSPDSQEKLLRDYAKKNNIVLLEVFFEIGVSGRKAEKRPEFQRMIGAAKSPEHPVDVILVWKFSRFARNQEESIVYKSLLKKQSNVDVISVSEPLIDGPFGSLIERIIEWMDEYYSIRLSGEVIRGMEEKIRRKGYVQQPPLGYQAVGDGKPFVINEENFRIVEYMAQQFDEYGKDYTAIARDLNDMGYLTQRGNLFEARTVERVLTNPFYYGWVEWRDIGFMGDHEVRFTKEQFDRRMEKIRSQYRPIKRRSVSACKHWLSGLLKCGVCGASLSYACSGHSPGFQCWKYAKGFHKESMSISEKKIIEAVCEYFEKLLDGMDFEYEYRPPETEETSQRDLLMEELDRIASREHRIRLAFENGVDSLEEYRENKERLKKARKSLQEQIENLTEAPPEKPSREAVLSKVQTVYDIIRDPEVDYDTKGVFMRSLLEDIVYDKKNGRLIFHLYVS